MIKYALEFTRALRQWDAFTKGKRVMLTIENPDAHETNRRMIRVPAESVGWRRPVKGGAPAAEQQD